MTQRTPTRLKVLRGEHRPSRLPKGEPIPAAGPPIKPAGISDEAGVIWDGILADYAQTRLLTRIDGPMLYAYVEAVARTAEATSMLARSGPLVRSKRGGADQLAKNPLHQIVRDNAMLALRLARELGFTPAARAGLRVPDEGGELDRWIRGG